MKRLRRAPRTMPTERGIAYGPRGLRRRSHHSSQRAGKLRTRRRMAGGLDTRPQGGTRDAERRNCVRCHSEPWHWTEHETTGEPNTRKRVRSVRRGADRKGPTGTSLAAYPTDVATLTHVSIYLNLSCLLCAGRCMMRFSSFLCQTAAYVTCRCCNGLRCFISGGVCFSTAALITGWDR